MSMEAQAASAKAASFPCQGCGGMLQFNAESQQLKCHYCGGEQSIDSLMEQPQEHPFDDREDSELDPSLTNWGTQQQAIHCENCGGESLVPALQTSVSCAFCGSTKVLAQGTPDTIRPESVIPFQKSREEAIALFRKWKRKRWFVPTAFKKTNVNAQLHGIYVPYWTYDTNTYSVYTAEVGIYHYRTVTRTRVVNGKSQTYTTTERYTVWHRTNGDYERWFDDILIPASGHYDNTLLRKLGDFDLSKLHHYRPDYLSGFIAERYSVSRNQGWIKAQNEADQALRHEIKRKIGGDEIRNLSVRTNYSDITYKHLLLPVWNASYTFKNKLYHFMVNGQTGTVSGRVPRSAAKITLFTIGCVAAVAAAIFIYQST